MVAERIISSDSHVVEPPDLWTERLGPKLRDRAPHLERRADGDVFVTEGLEPAPVASFSAAGNLEIRFDTKARWEEAVRRGGYDPHARQPDMERDGIAAEVLYPTVALGHFGIEDPLLRRACFRAYNDWIAEYCRTYPAKLKGIGMVDTEDVDAAIDELRRVRGLGLVGAMISISPTTIDLYTQPAFDPFWATAVELGLPISLHTGTNRERQKPLAQRTVGELSTHAVFAQRTLVDLIYGGVFHRHPDLKVLSVENGAGWAPYLLQSMDNAFHTAGREDLPFGRGGLKPSDHFRRNVKLTFMRDPFAIQCRHLIGLQCLLWSSDYPHRESTFPKSREVLAAQLEGVPEADRQAIVARNTAELYGFN